MDIDSDTDTEDLILAPFPPLDRTKKKKNGKPKKERKKYVKKKISMVWSFFIMDDSSRVKCKICKRKISITEKKSSGNAIRHLRRKHPEEVADFGWKEDPQAAFRKGRRRSLAWKHFTKNEDGSYKCNECFGVFAHMKGQVSNLMRHIRNVHPEIQPENGWEKDPRYDDLVWDNFVVLNGKQMASCLICNTFITYTGDSNYFLLLHLRTAHKDLDNLPKVIKKKTPVVDLSRPKKSRAWKYYDVMPGEVQKTCKFCGSTIAAAAGTGNLIRHLRRMHEDLFVRKGDKVFWPRLPPGTPPPSPPSTPPSSTQQPASPPSPSVSFEFDEEELEEEDEEVRIKQEIGDEVDIEVEGDIEVEDEMVIQAEEPTRDQKIFVITIASLKKEHH